MTTVLPGRGRRPVRRRPPWLVGVLIAVALVVVFALLFGLWKLVSGGSTPEAATQPEVTASPCVTVTMPTSKLLPPPNQVRVNVYNSTPTTGLAKKTARELSAKGFKISKVANDPLGKKISGVAQIRYGPRGELSAQLLLLYVPGAEMVNDYRAGKRVDLSTGKTFSGLSPQQGVKALLAAPTAVASGPGCSPGTAPVQPQGTPVPSATP
jgi:hypothetical protein